MSQVAAQGTPPAAAQATPTNPAVQVDPKVAAQAAGASDPKAADPAAQPPKEAPKEASFEEKMAKERQRIASQRQAKLKQREQEKIINDARAVLGSWKDFQKDPLEWLEKNGYGYDKLTEAKMQRGTPDAKFQTVNQQIEQIRAEHSREIKALRDQLSQEKQNETQETIDNWKRSIGTFVSEHPDDYQLIPKFKGEDLVAETAEEFFKAHGKVLSNKEAADLVEAYFEEQVLDAAQTKRIQTKLSPPKEAQGDPKGSGARQPTVTNTTVGTANVSGLSPATEADRMARAMAALG